MTDSESDRTRLRYRFSPLERRGVIAGWRGGQIGSVAMALVLAVLFLRARPSPAGVAAAVVWVAIGVAAAFWPLRGRTLEQWSPLVLEWSLAGAGGRRQLAPGPGQGHLLTARPATGRPVLSPTRRSARHARNGVFAGIRLRALALGEERQPAGVVFDDRGRTATAVLALRGHSFALLSPVDQEARVAGWASVLASLAREGTAVHRLQWIESCLPDAGDAVRRHFDEEKVDHGSAATRSYRALLEELAPVTRRHRVVMALSIHLARSARAVRSSGGGDRGAAAVLGREVDALRRALESADVWVDGVLGPRALAGLLRNSTEPVAPREEPRRRVTAPEAGTRGGDDLSDAPPGTPESWPHPMALQPGWDCVRTDGTWHATYWIAEWPRVEVTSDFLGPLLFVPLRRSISLVMEPMSPSRAARQVARAQTADIADGELRRRTGFLVSARQRRERHGVEERDGELADGHGQYRFAGYVTVTADSRAELERSAATLEQVAGQSHLELRRLYGEQDAAFACSLPLGRGLR